MLRILVASAGADFGDYRSWLVEQGIDVGGIALHPGAKTACCFITSDKAHCQITGFYVGAMKLARELSLAEQAGPRAALAVIAPDDPEAMLRHCREASASGLPFVFDPSFQVTAMDARLRTKQGGCPDPGRAA